MAHLAVTLISALIPDAREDLTLLMCHSTKKTYIKVIQTMIHIHRMVQPEGAETVNLCTVQWMQP